MRAKPTCIGAPSITGTPEIGQELVADPGKWEPDGCLLAIRWERFAAGRYSTVDTSPAYVVSPDDAGRLVRAVVSASHRGRATVFPTKPVLVADRP